MLRLLGPGRDTSRAGHARAGALRHEALRRRRRRGAASASVDRADLAPIDGLVDLPPLPRDVIDLANFVAGYYRAPLGEALALAVPPLGERSRERPRPRLPDRVALADAGRAALDALAPRARAARALRDRLAASSAGLDAAAIAALAAADRRRLLDWWQAGWLVDGAIAEAPARHDLNAAQRDAIEAIDAARGRYAAFLLDGVTGSGKTDVYAEAAARAIERGGQVLVLVPEIHLTPQLAARFARALPGRRIVTLHSALVDGERRARWLAAANGEADLVLGTRLAVFAPLAAARARGRRRGARRVLQAAGRRALPRARRRDLARARPRGPDRARQRDALARDAGRRAPRPLRACSPCPRAPIRAHGRPPCASCRRTTRAEATDSARRSPRRSARGSSAASSRSCSSTGVATRRRSSARPARGRPVARAARRGSCSIASRRASPATTAGMSRPCRAAVRRAATSTSRRAGHGTQRARAGARRTFPGRAHRARRSRLDAPARRVRRAPPARVGRHARHPRRHADAREGARLPAAHARRRARRRQRALQRRLPRGGTAGRAAVPGGRAGRPGGAARRSARADGVPRASGLRGAGRRRLRAGRRPPARRAPRRGVAALRAPRAAVGRGARRAPTSRPSSTRRATTRSRCSATGTPRSRCTRPSPPCSRARPATNARSSACRPASARRCGASSIAGCRCCASARRGACAGRSTSIRCRCERGRASETPCTESEVLGALE